MKKTLERELKLDVDPGFVLPDLGGTPLAARTFMSTYYDTPDRRLLGAGITLRRRVEKRAGIWQLKLPAAEGRLELEQRGGPARPPGAFLDLLPALLRGGAVLEPVAKLRTRRAGVTVADRESRIEVTVDAVETLDGGRVASTFAEIEAEVVAGDGAALSGLAKTLRKAGARRSDGRPKLLRVLGPDEETAPGELEDAGERVRSLLVAQYRALVANDPGVRLGEDPEAVHQFRVATRRARAILRAARELLPHGWAQPLRAELAWLAGLLGPVRDLDVLLEYLDSEIAGLERDDAQAFGRLRSKLAAQRAAARLDLLAAMSDERYFQLLDALEQADRAAEVSGASTLPEIAGQAFGRLRKTAKALPKQPSDSELHRVRIEAKRARYAAELGGPALGKRGAHFVARAKVLQDVIGEHQDAYVAEQRIRELAVRSGSRAALAAGRVIERQRKRKRAARRAFPAAWRALEKAGRSAFS